MKAKPTFMARDASFADIERVEFTPLIYIVGAEVYRFALHLECGNLPNSMKQWRVSHPTIGATVCRVTGSYKGMPCSSVGMGPRDARQHAIASLDSLIERIGSDRFNSTISAQIERFSQSRIDAIREKIHDEHATGLDS